MKTPTDSDLRSLDAADATLDPGQRSRADAMLERIVATPVTAENTPALARRQRRISGKVMWIPLTTAAAAVGAFFISGPGGPSTAYASWASTPSAVAAPDLDAVTAACRKLEAGGARGDQGANFDPATIPVAIAERRGDFVAVLFLQDNPDVAVSCVATNRPGTSSVRDLSTATGGSSGPASIAPAGRIVEGAVSQFGDQPPASFTSGSAGAGVVGVTIHAGGQSITATVKNGRYLAWWPGKAFTDEPQQPSGEGGPRTVMTYDVTLSDGTTKTNVSALPD